MKWLAPSALATAMAAGSLMLSVTSAWAVDRIIVATFTDTAQAVAAAEAFKSRPLFGAAAGAGIGALIGLIGGVPGMLLGATLEATTGQGADAIVSNYNADFVNAVRLGMRPSTEAVMVEADEGSTSAVDGIAARGGGHVDRQIVS